MVDKRARKLEGLQKELLSRYIPGAEKPEVLLVGFGTTQNAVAEAVGLLNSQGVSIGALSFGDIYPLPQKSLHTYWQQAKAVYTVEQNATRHSWQS